MPNTIALDDTILSPFIGSTLHLYTTAPTDESDGVEVTGGSYSPQPTNLTQDLSDLDTARNADNIIFTGLPATTVVAYGIKDSGGTLIYYEALSSPKTLDADAIMTVPINTLTVAIA